MDAKQRTVQKVVTKTSLRSLTCPLLPSMTHDKFLQQIVQSPRPMLKHDVMAQLEALKLRMAECYGVQEIGIFGSVARGEATVSSDLDVVVLMPPNMLNRVCLREELEKIFGSKVDVIRYWQGMNPYLKARIDREAIYA